MRITGTPETINKICDFMRDIERGEIDIIFKQKKKEFRIKVHPYNFKSIIGPLSTGHAYSKFDQISQHCIDLDFVEAINIKEQQNA
jgi:hypothetical protein